MLLILWRAVVAPHSNSVNEVQETVQKLRRAAVVGLVLTGGVLAVAGPAFADEDESAGAAQGPSSANDVTPAGVPVFGLLESVEGAPKRLSPEPESTEDR
ncbi:hypothetical protein GCM10023321_68040 [Pseudonocardia eucalypti]|uniref:Uncharacterized protein n=1 Tax=Pseudonocardia eucalypti TaxID=648755 RepID=A0ABP9R1Y0_9PSEU